MAESITILNERPPIWDQVISAGLRFNPKTTVFAWGNVIYNPGGGDLPEHVIEHEATHLHQQNGDPVSWWIRYLNDSYFRISQEAEAFGAQYAFICRSVRDRNLRARILNDLATFLSGPMYGNMLTLVDARNMIIKEANIKQ